MYKIGDFIIYGEHENDPEGLSIRIKPYSIGAAYPWWSETTQKVLKVMQELSIKGATVLDLGCGASTILAQAAKKLDAKSVVACEHDKKQLIIAEKQVEGMDIKVILKDDNKNYDIIIANIGDSEFFEDLNKRSKHGICTSKEGDLLRW